MKVWMFLIVCPILSGADMEGVLRLVDRPPQATPVEALSFQLHPLARGMDLWAQPDRDGRFTIKDVRPGRYMLIFPMPGRIEKFTSGTADLDPADFELMPGPLELVVSMKVAEVAVRIERLPSGGERVAMVAPADRYLTLRSSCISNPVTGPETTFRYLPPGKYRIFIVDQELAQDVAGYAPRFPDFLRDQATPVEAVGGGRVEATAVYIDPETVRGAIRRAGPLFPNVRK